MTHVLHISCDYPDSIQSQKTTAVANLVTHCKDLQHSIISLNRTTSIGSRNRAESDRNLIAMNYFGLPFGIGLKPSLKYAARRALRLIDDAGIAPDLIHGHKLTFEGQVAYHLSKALNVPMVCSVRGDTDLKLIRYKPGSRRLFRRILSHSSGKMYIAPWARKAMENLWPEETAGLACTVPNIVPTALDAPGPVLQDSSRFVTVFHLKEHRRKNIARLVRAFDQCVSSGLQISLDIVGGGENDHIAAIRTAIDATQNPGAFELKGQRSREEIFGALPDYAALLLPSYPETFGMVYLEALRAGVPILHSRNAGVDGYFADKGVAMSVDPRSVDEIAAGIERLNREQVQFKAAVSRLNDSGYMAMFDTKQICSAYTEFVARATGADA